jgi:hypothetical protein
MANNGCKTDHPFHVSATAIGIGTDYNVRGIENNMMLDFVIEEGTTFSANILAQVYDKSAWKAYPVKQESAAGTVSIAVTDATYFYGLNLIGLTAVRVDVTALEGTLSVYGRATG